jgi:peptidoglycan/xylan/chitin deacetylase (PgdA/CDA1 family)
MTRIFLLTLLTALSLTSALYAEKPPWHGKRCAVCLTYDDALNVDLDNVVPLLDSLGMRATFYISGSSKSFRARWKEWRNVAAKGNELGNHTLFHPCEGKAPGREWVKTEYDLNGYTVERMVNEIDMANVLLAAIDGKSRRTFAYPCGDRKAGDSSYVGELKERFVAARGVEGKMQKINEIDLFDVGAYVVNGQSGSELVGTVEKAMEKNALLVFLFHGVGGGHDLNVSLDAHRQLLRFLKKNRNEIWVAPLIDIAEYVKAASGSTSRE